MRCNGKNLTAFVPKVESLELLSLVSQLDFGMIARGDHLECLVSGPSCRTISDNLTARTIYINQLSTVDSFVNQADKSANTYYDFSPKIMTNSHEPTEIASNLGSAEVLLKTFTIGSKEVLQAVGSGNPGNAITLTPTISPRSQHGNAPPTTPGLDGIGSSWPSVPQTTPLDPYKTQPGSSSSPVANDKFSSSGANSQVLSSQGFRPLSLAPVSNLAGLPMARRSLTPADSGGGPPVHTSPSLTFSGGGAGANPVLDGANNPIPGQFQGSQPVPIGSIVVVTTSDGPVQGSSNNPSYLWGGGTNYSGYFSTNADANSDPNVSLVKNVDPTQYTYTFIVDATPRTYKIDLHEVFTDGGSSDAFLTFSSVAPTASIASVMSDQTLDLSGGIASVGMSRPAGFQASGSTGPFTDGSFMFLQIVNNSYLQYTDTAGANPGSHYKKNNMVIDGQNYNGPLHDGNLTAYLYSWPQNPGLGLKSFWSIAASSSLPFPNLGNPTMGDTVQFVSPVPTTINNTQNVTKISLITSFSTYIMYGKSGVWIGVSKLDWTESETATFVGGVLTGPTSAQPQPAGASSPMGDTAFPTWVNTSSNFLAANFQSGDPGP